MDCGASRGCAGSRGCAASSGSASAGRVDGTLGSTIRLSANYHVSDRQKRQTLAALAVDTLVS